jgi:hypothetical protein
MRLVSLHFLLGAASLLGATAAQAQPGGYEPPPVEYADQAPAAGPTPSRVAPPEELGPPPPRVGPPRARVDIGGYVEVEGGVSAELAGGGGDLLGDEVLTYTSVAAGVDGQVVTRRVAASFAYEYERRFELNGDLPDDDVHSGIAQASAQLVPGRVSVEAGGIATRTGGTGRAIGVTEREAGAKIYSGYVGPTLSTRAGPVALNAFYRLGYVHVDDDSLAGGATPDGRFNSTVHVAGASASAPPGPAPIGWTVSAGHVSESSSDFDTEFEAQFVRGDAVLPVNPSLALTAGIGYSRAKATQSDFLRDANGDPVFDNEGNLFADPRRPRLISYNQDGLFADAGFIWRPSPRSELQLRAGINDDGEPIVAGFAAFQVGRNFGFSFTLFDEDETFGTNLVNNIKDLPTEFEIERNPLGGGVNASCVFDEKRPGRGVCLSPALQSLTAASYRARGGSLLFSGNGRLWSWGGGISYTRRDFHLPDDPIFEDAFAPSDQDLALFGTVGRRLGRDADISFDGYLSFYDSEAPNSDVTSIGARSSFSRGFLLNRLELIVALGLAYQSVAGDEDSLIGNAIIGLRYNF